MGARRHSSITALLVAGITLLACTAELSQPTRQGMLPSAGNHGSSVGGTGAGGVSTGGASAGRAGGLSHAGSGGSAGSMAGAPPTEPTVFSRTGLPARLSKFEYQHSISDVLGESVLPAELDASADG